MKQRLESLTEFAGWIGVMAILLAYGLLSFGILDSGHVGYHTLNLAGGVGIIVDALADKNYQPVVLNLIWCAIAVYAIVKVVV
jgi:hypothetical protein